VIVTGNTGLKYLSTISGPKRIGTPTTSLPYLFTFNRNFCIVIDWLMPE
jgi:hypothetical protein